MSYEKLYQGFPADAWEADIAPKSWLTVYVQGANSNHPP